MRKERQGHHLQRRPYGSCKGGGRAQVHTLLKGLEKIAASADIPMLVAGDFNSVPGSAAHSLLVKQSVDPGHPVRSHPGPDPGFPGHGLCSSPAPVVGYLVGQCPAGHPAAAGQATFMFAFPQARSSHGHCT